MNMTNNRMTKIILLFSATWALYLCAVPLHS